MPEHPSAEQLMDRPIAALGGASGPWPAATAEALAAFASAPALLVHVPTCRCRATMKARADAGARQENFVLEVDTAGGGAAYEPTLLVGACTAARYRAAPFECERELAEEPSAAAPASAAACHLAGSASTARGSRG